jgi:SPP1 gp7 family putative phage head morphogenesis protein
MEVTVPIYTEAFRKNYDPTHTTALRNMFARDMRKRFEEIIKAVRVGVDDNDCFGLKRPHTLQVTTPAEGAFAFARSQEKLAKFMKWLDRQVEAGILTVKDLEQIGTSVEAMWMNKYLYDSYKRGLIRARYELQLAGFKVPSIDDTGGIGIVMGLPMHIDRIGLIFTRVFTELKGITDAMDSVISQVLAQGLADGDGPRLLARKLVAAIDGTNLGKLGITDRLGRFIPAQRRAEMLARTEIIRAHHLATIQEYRNWGVLNIHLKAEWKTAGDDRVCPECAKREGKVYTLDEAEGMVPLHPNCRCIVLPWSEELLQYETK